MRSFLVQTTIALLSSFLASARVQAAPPIPFPDKNLEAAVRTELHEDKAPLTDDKLNNLFVLESSGKGIQNLKGLEKCKNLELIKLSKNQIADVTPLKGLTNLQSLDLADNKIADVTPLAGLTALQYLELSRNQIAKVDGLSKLTNLSALYLTGNKISDLTPLAGLIKLSSLSLDHNQIRDIGPLLHVTKLSTLNLNDNQLDNLAPLTKQTEISLLMLERNRIADLSPLVSMAKADAEGQKRFAPYLRLYLKDNPLTPAAQSGQIAALKGYGVRIESLGVPVVQVAKTGIALTGASASELAQVLGYDVRSFDYAGSPMVCWIEVQEIGQQTLPKGWAEHLKKTSSQRDQGKIIFAFPNTTLSYQQGRRFVIGYIGNGLMQRQSVDIPDKALWLGGWKGGFGATVNSPLNERPLAVEPGKDLTLLEITVAEPNTGQTKGRKVKVLLKGKFVAGPKP